jgi:flagellar biosynthetic protein FlhB
MADVDKDSKTEEPTSKKLGEAQGKGEVAKSQEVNHWFMISAAALVVAVFGNYVAGGIRERLRVFLAAPHDTELSMANLRAIFTTLGEDLVVLLLGPLAILVAAALASSLAQHPMIWAVSKLKPQLGAFNPIKGVKQKLSLSIVVEFAKDLAKFAVIGTVVVALLWPESKRLIELHTIGADQIMPLVKALALKVFIAVILIMSLLALGDYAYQRFDYRKQKRMTKEEVKDERKQSEGDPKIKQKLHSIRVNRMRQRMMAAVPEADVVITNPTHYAVALQYVPEIMDAPKVLAKGRDLVALRIRELAERNEIPLVENPPLARALHDSAEVNQDIPVEHYKAVAEVIGYVMRLRGGLRSARQARMG